MQEVKILPLARRQGTFPRHPHTGDKQFHRRFEMKRNGVNNRFTAQHSVQFSFIFRQVATRIFLEHDIFAVSTDHHASDNHSFPKTALFF